MLGLSSDEDCDKSETSYGDGQSESSYGSDRCSYCGEFLEGTYDTGTNEEGPCDGECLLRESKPLAVLLYTFYVLHDPSQICKITDMSLDDLRHALATRNRDDRESPSKSGRKSNLMKIMRSDYQRLGTACRKCVHSFSY